MVIVIVEFYLVKTAETDSAVYDRLTKKSHLSDMFFR